MPSRNRLKEFVMILIKDTFAKRWSESQEVGMRHAIPKGPWHGPGRPAGAGESNYCDL